MRRIEWEPAVKAFGAMRLSRYGDTFPWGRQNAAPFDFALSSEIQTVAPSCLPPALEGERHTSTLSLFLKTVYGSEEYGPPEDSLLYLGDSRNAEESHAPDLPSNAALSSLEPITNPDRAGGLGALCGLIIGLIAGAKMGAAGAMIGGTFGGVLGAAASRAATARLLRWLC